MSTTAAIRAVLIVALRRGLRVTSYAPGLGVVVALPDGATVLDGVLASLLTARSEDVATLLAADGVAELLAELAAEGIGDGLEGGP